MYRVNTQEGMTMTPEEQRKAETTAGWEDRIKRTRRNDFIAMIVVYGLLLLAIYVVTGGLSR